MFQRLNTSPGTADSLKDGGGKINQNLGETIIPLNYLVTGQGSDIGPYSDGAITDESSFVYYPTNPYDIPQTIANITTTETYMWFVPAFERQGANIKRVAIQRVTSGTWQAKGGLYSNNGLNKALPDTLLVDFGTLTLTTGHGGGEAWNIDYTVPADGLYWYGMKFSVANTVAGWSSSHPSMFGYVYPYGSGQNIQSMFGVRLQDVVFADDIPTSLSGRTFYACLSAAGVPKTYRGYAAFTEPS